MLLGRERILIGIKIITTVSFLLDLKDIIKKIEIFVVLVGITLNRETSGRAHFRGLAPGQHNLELRRNVVMCGEPLATLVSALIGSGMESQIFCTDSYIYSRKVNLLVLLKMIFFQIRLQFNND